MPDALVDRKILEFENALSIVMKDLERNLLDVLGAAKTGSNFDAAVLVNSQPAMIEALRDAGYFAIAEEHIAAYAEIPKLTAKEYKALGFPVEYTTVDKADFQALAQMDLDQFNNIGIAGMNELRLGLVRNAVSGAPFSQMVEAVRAASTGVDGEGSPLANHAYTHANTSILQFNGEANIKAAESTGHDKDTDKWRVFGPLDGKTRPICQEALSEPVRTREEWEAFGYFGGAPGGYNCRHRLRPVRDSSDD